MGLSISGLSSGFDWQSMIEQLQTVYTSQYVDPLTTKQTTIEKKSSAWSDLATKLSTLQTALADLKDSDDYDVFKTSLSSSDSSVTASDVLSASADSSASTGQYSIKVTQLAQARKIQSATYDSADEEDVMSGTLTVAGNEVDLSGKSLDDIADEINSLNSESDTGVSAGVVKYVDDSNATKYRLVLKSDDTGADGMEITDGSTNHDFSVSDGSGGYELNELQAGQDAEFYVDGFKMTSAGNTVTDAIEGVTLNLKSSSSPSTAFTLDISSDTDSISDKVQTLVDAFNDVSEYISGQMSYDTTTGTKGGVLFGDANLKSIKNTIQSTILNARSSAGTAMSALGVTFEDDGTLSFDSSDLEDALSSDYSDTIDLLSQVGQSFYKSVNGYTDSVDGTVTNQIESLDDSSARLDDKITSAEDLVARKVALLTKQYTAMETALSDLSTQASYVSSLLTSSSS